MPDLKIDINCDMGESFGNFTIGNDEQIFPYITSCNIACGFHGGDPLHIEKTIKRAIQYKVRIGAHPSYPDLQGFGRRPMQVPSDELIAILKYQIAALKGLTESLGGQLTYVKPHGALYNTAVKEIQVALTIARAIAAIDTQLAFMGLAGSKTMQEAAVSENIRFIAEAFADRRYTDAGSLQSRSIAGSVLHDPEEAARQVHSLVTDRRAISSNGNSVAINAQSICIHGDNPQAVNILQRIDQSLKENHIQKCAF